MRQTTKIFMAMASVSLMAQASAQGFGQGFSITPGGGFYAFDSELLIDDASFPAIGLEYRMTEHWGVELHYLTTETEQKFNSLAKFDFEQVRLDGNYYFRPQQQLQPYVSAGVGMFNLKQQEKGIDVEENLADVGAGVRYFVNQYFSLRSDLRAVNNIDNGYTEAMLNVGLNLVLGGGTTDVSEGDIDLAQAQSEPQAQASVPVNADADGDGIADIDDDCLNTDPNLMVDDRGCPIAVEKTVSMDLNVNFAFESSELPPEFYSDVKELATFLKLYKDSVVTIEGHADATGPEWYNQGLSERRAKAIRDILVKDFEIQRDRLKYVGYGEAKPVAGNETATGRSKNRRAATIVTATREVEKQKQPESIEQPSAKQDQPSAEVK